jgi:hypothetical protein
MSEWPEGTVRRERGDGSYEALFICDDSFGPPALAVVIAEDEAKELVREHRKEMHEEMFGESLQ